MAQPTRRVSSYHRDNFDADWTFIENGIDLYMSSSVNDAKKIRASCRWLTMYTVVYKLCHAMPHPRGEMIYGNLSQLFTTYVETLTAVYITREKKRMYHTSTHVSGAILRSIARERNGELDDWGPQKQIVALVLSDDVQDAAAKTDS
ncbi:hypothetical protein IEO21_00936 [Rhodonia placenta]|uniref:Uncharacterized protein n=1 Tax=Rhodonia placenta TaxID=104341 RepID=A0A8H7PAC7_9APHY|nr:hypothetical protein IEO21_00936 [Postia placenta]